MPERKQLRTQAARARLLIRSIGEPAATAALRRYAAECEAEAALREREKRVKRTSLRSSSSYGAGGAPT
jgi:septal ring factor EnvC (AmiA/AmiB activator)